MYLGIMGDRPQDRAQDVERVIQPAVGFGIASAVEQQPRAGRQSEFQ